jgi:hypothetical protein
MGVAVEHDARGVAIQRLLETTGAEERIDLERLPVDGVADGRVVEEHDAPRRPQPGQRGLELQGLVDGRAHERLDRLLAPRLQRELAEAAGEAFRAGEADARDLDGRPVEDGHVGLSENLRHVGGGIRLEVVVAQHRDLRHLDGPKLLGQDPRLVGETAIGEIAAQREHVRALGDPCEECL